MIAVLVIVVLALAAVPVRSEGVSGSYTPPPRGAPSGRLGGASRDIAIGEQRVALVVGNSAYRHAPPLANPVNDANAMAETLRGLGFEVIVADNADRTEMVKALGQFRKALRTDGVGLFYYAGHGIQLRGKNYLVPIDADIADENDASLLAIDLDSVQYAMEDAGVRLSLYILDACRDDPFEHKVRGAGARGLAAVDAARGSVIAFATAPGRTAADGSGEHGLFTGELLKAIVQPGLELEDVLKRTAEGVERDSGNQQTPWYNSAFHGHFIFSPVTVNIAPPADARKEVVFWESIKGSGDPADFEDFLRQFPNSDFASLAQRRIAALRASPAPPPPPPPGLAPPPSPALTAAPPPPPPGAAGRPPAGPPPKSGNLQAAIVAPPPPPAPHEPPSASAKRVIAFSVPEYPKPGMRDMWSNTGGAAWVERPTTGSTQDFHAVERIDVDNCPGSRLVSDRPEGHVEAFIPDVGCPNMTLRLKVYVSGGNPYWSSFGGTMQDVVTAGGR